MEALPKTTALILIDLQKAIDHPSWGARNNTGAEARARRLLEHWRRTARPIAHVRHLSREPGSTYAPGQPGAAFKEDTAPKDGELIVTKHRPCALIGTNLEQWLRDGAVSHLVIVGVITNNSVEATARVAADVGFATIVVSDATFTFGRADFDGRWRTAEEVHAMSLANLAGEYARIASTAEVIEAAG